MASDLRATQVWAEALGLPEALERTITDARGFDEAAALLGGPAVRRIVATGNGASYYVAHALWLASLASRPAGLPEVVALPAGLLARGFSWREGDRLLVVSSSGRLRDAIEALEAGAPRPYAAITAAEDSPIGAGAGACAVVHVERQEATTHTQAYCGNLVAALAVWARLARDETLAQAVRSVPDEAATGLAEADTWVGRVAPEAGTPIAAIAFGDGPAWAAALETALLVKEIARIPAEGVETREGATSAMYGLAPGHLALSLPTGDDSLVAEAEETCRAAGATVVRVPGGSGADPRLSPVTTFPAALALAVVLGLRAELDVDHPGWADAYFATARVASPARDN